MRRNSNSSNSQIPLTQSPCITPKSQLTQGQTKTLPERSSPVGLRTARHNPRDTVIPAHICARLQVSLYAESC